MKTLGKKMSFQSVLRVMARMRALRIAASRELVASRQSTRRSTWAQSQHRWLSMVSKDDFSWQKPVGNREPLEQLQNDHDSHDTDSSITERDKRLDEIRNSLHGNIERILKEKPAIKNKWRQNIRRRQREQRRQSLSLSSSPRNTDSQRNQTNEINSKANSQSSNDSTELVEVWSEEAAHGVDTEIQPASTPQDDFEATWNTSSSSAAESEQTSSIDNEESSALKPETHEKTTSLLDVLRQPIEDEKDVSPGLNVYDESDAVQDVESVSHHSSLLSLLTDDDAFHDINETASSQVSDTPESPEAQPASLLDLLNDDDVVPENNKTDSYLNTIEIARDAPSSLLDVLDQPIEDEPDSNDVSRNLTASLADTNQAEEGNDTDIVGEQSDTWSSVEGWHREPMGGNVIGNDSERRLSKVVDEGLALLLALKGRDWSQMDDADESDEIDDPLEDSIEGDHIVEEGIEEEYLELDLNTDIDGTTHDEELELGGDDSVLENVEELLEEASFGEIVLSSTDYNALLLHVATSSLQTDDAISLIVRTYQQMTELGRAGADCSPDATTFTILMVALDRRANAPLSAVDVCRQMMDKGVELNSAALVQGLSCLNKRNQISDTERLMNSVLDNEASQLVVPTCAWISLLGMYKNENMQDDALNLIEKCINKNGGRGARTLEKVITETISWPRKDRGRRRLDRISLLSKVLDKLESFSTRGNKTLREDGLFAVTGAWNGGETLDNTPSYHVWRRLVVSLASEVDDQTNSGWSLVHRAFISMQNAVQDFWPDSSLLKTGLRVAEVTGDAKLAVDLVLRLHSKQMNEADAAESVSMWSAGDVAGDDHSSLPPTDVLPESLGTQEYDMFGATEATPTDEVDAPADTIGGAADTDSDSGPSVTRRGSVRVPLQAYTAAMRVCAAVGDIESADKLLDGLRGSRNMIPDSKKSDLYSLALKGCAKTGNSDVAQALLKEMQDTGLNPT